MSGLKWMTIGAVLLAVVGCGTGGGGDGEAFSNGVLSVEATTTETATGKRTAITEDGTPLVNMDVTVAGISLAFPAETTELTTITFNTPLDALPGDVAMNHLATFVAGQLFGDGGSGLPQDDPGCDMFPDTRCTMRCCADHANCYATNNCSSSSWIPGQVPADSDYLLWACSNCNDVAAACILRSCANAAGSGSASDVCVDAACGASYTCPSPNELDCFACESPCPDTPALCGNGSCESGETVENCASDCAIGLGVNTCCRANDNCPSETPSDCEGECCCCDDNQVCGEGNLCGDS